MTLAIRNSRSPVASDPSLVAAGADEAEADTPKAVAAYPSVIDAERHPLYGHGVQQPSPAEVGRGIAAHILSALDRAQRDYPTREEREHVRQSRLSRWQEQR